ncbi:MAG: RnfABCDGE type electron transport complex subunit B [Pseudomonadota bacterium]|nr:RnfABCDGE type electron transport complex subunit B [Pseudomonadota bacterium]
MSRVVEKVLEVLPQTQCEECGFKGCRPYAEAIVEGAAIDLCAPGGDPVFSSLKKITGRSGSANKVRERYVPPQKAIIDQQSCIGCTKCIKPCPTMAIMGYKKQNHFVIASDCTGCGLCLEYCPVDCISMEPDIMSHETALSLASEYQALYNQKTQGEVERSLVIKDKKQLLDDIADIMSGG